ncbi:DNA-3-methyladenine glycosylase 2 [Zafaria sp. Z1313]|uniref:DNA-3-methyladenine glycosylase 2 n=1 Tax=Zafaria sp. Z1313 TaxID=3423202 RepID=UPI003D303199
MSAAAQSVRLELEPGPGGLDPLHVLAVLRAHAVPGVELASGTDPDDAGATFRRLVPCSTAYVEATLRFTRELVLVDARGPGTPTAGGDPDWADELASRIRAWLDLDADLGPVVGHLRRDPALAPLVAARPSLRRVGFLDPVEALATTILGQQVSLAACRTFSGRLVQAFGRDGPGGLRIFPDAAELAETDPGHLHTAVGITGQRALTLHAAMAALAAAMPVAGLDPRGGPGFPLARAELLGLRGIGPWTADYLAVRAGFDPDAFTPGDLVLRRALGRVDARAAEERSHAWSPYRAYALFHCWAAQLPG